MNSDQGKGEPIEAPAGGQEGSLRAPSISPSCQLAYLQQLVEEIHLVLVPGLRLVPHKLHQSCRRDEKHGTLGWVPGPDSYCHHTGPSPAISCLALNRCVSQVERQPRLY